MDYAEKILSRMDDKGKDTLIRHLLDEIETLTTERVAIQKATTSATPSTTTFSGPDSAFDVLAVTQVQVFPFKEGPTHGHVKALASVVLNDQLHIRGLRVMDGENGLYVGYPVDPYFKGEDSRSVTFPITRQLREHIENCVLEKYQAAISD